MLDELRELLATDVVDDGIDFDPESLALSRIRRDSTVLGLRAKLDGYLGRTRLRYQIDFGLGDAVYPEPELVVLDGTLDLPVAEVLAYTPYTTVAEKLEAIVVLGMANTRMKDYWDLSALPARLDFDGAVLVETLRRTFGRRDTPLPDGLPEGLGDRFAGDPVTEKRWQAFLRKSRLRVEAASFAEVVDAVRGFAEPVLQAAGRPGGFEGAWKGGGPWQPLDGTRE